MGAMGLSGAMLRKLGHRVNKTHSWAKVTRKNRNRKRSEMQRESRRRNRE